MRLHRLEIEAFGPFADRAVVDFDALGADGLFLLHGATGAGKSSVLDAVCFALYGRVPGARGGGRARLRSDHAGDDAVPQVVLELTAGGRRLEVTRSPEWQRPKRRGAGTTREPARCDVRELVAGRWQVQVGRRSDEAALLLTDVLGMGLDQFTQVVLLPQGEFAAFLRAGADQRAAVLQRLFAIDRFSAAEDWLRAERQQLAREVSAADEQGRGLLDRAHEAFLAVAPVLLERGELDPLTDQSALAEPPRELVATFAAAADRAAEHATSEVDHRTRMAAAARGAHESAVERRSVLDRHCTLLEQLARLDADTAARHDLATALELADRAAPLQLLATAVDVAATRSDAAVRLLEATRSRCGGRSLAGLATLRERLTRVTDALPVEAELARGRERLAGLTLAIATATSSAQSARARLVELGAARELAGRQVADLSALAATLPAAERDLATAGRTAAAATDLVDADAAAVLARRTRDDVRGRSLTARDALLDVRERRLAGFASELAQALEDDVPCAVCGSPTHPHPAPAGADPVDRVAEDEARDLVDRLSAELARAERAVADAERRVAELAAHAHGHGPETARHVLELAGQARDRAATAAAELDAARHGLDQADALISRAGDELDTAVRVAAGEEAERSVLSAQLTDAAARVDALRGDAADLPALARALTEQVSALEALTSAQSAATGAGDDLAERTTGFADAAARAGFADAAQARAAAWDDERRKAVRQLLADHRDARRAVAALLADLPVIDQVHLEPVALQRVHAECDDLGTVASRADAHLQLAQAAQAVIAHASTSLRRLSGELLDHEGAHADLRARYARVDELSRCLDGAGGGNELRMRLSSFVLAARLEEVAAAASERLVTMSGGRFTLEHSDARAKGTARSGLGLVAVDGWTGVRRETSTLSGGESFMASLALALGLADVVRAEAGGAVVETLFVDEGFGSLDEESLDDVLGVLDGLRDGGRAIGLVSHVADLRDRVPARLEVRKDRSGSTLVHHLPGGPVPVAGPNGHAA